jgi:hypothetical protein
MVDFSHNDKKKRRQHTMSKHERDVQGIALYLEFRKPLSTAQVLITPDGLSGSGDGVAPAQFFRRTLSNGVSKRKWRAYSIRQLAGQKDSVLYESAVDELQANEDASNRFRNLGDYFDSLVRSGYKLVNDAPIYVEVTKEDLDAARQGNLSTKLWTRVKSSRASLGFPEEVIDQPSSSV